MSPNWLEQYSNPFSMTAIDRRRPTGQWTVKRFPSGLLSFTLFTLPLWSSSIWFVDLTLEGLLEQVSISLLCGICMEMEMSKKGRTLRIKTHAHYFSPVKEFARAKGTANYYETCFVVGVVGGCFLQEILECELCHCISRLYWHCLEETLFRPCEDMA